MARYEDTEGLPGKFSAYYNADGREILIRSDIPDAAFADVIARHCEAAYNRGRQNERSAIRRYLAEMDQET